jgi:hypothetical protein
MPTTTPRTANYHLSALMRAGRSAEAEQILSEASTAAERSYRAIRSDGSRTDEWKRSQLAAAFEEIRERVDRRLEAAARGVVDDERADFIKVFGVEGLPGDVASLAIARRDADDRVAQLETDAERFAFLAKVTRRGDEVLARAIAEFAYDTLNGKLLNEFLEPRPDLHEAGVRLWERALKGEQGGTFAGSMALAGLRPTELGGSI